MSLYVLDTDILTLFQQGHSVVQMHVAAHSRLDVATTVLSAEEQVSGWYTYVRQTKQPDKLAWAYQRFADTLRCLSTFEIISFDLPSIRRYEALRKLKLDVRKMDLRIAAIVLEVKATLVTRNARDFGQIPGLVFVDWSL
jgi:tRNA(fMet)-specific endonuclease VapC